MTPKNPNLHGNVPHQSRVALLLVDVLNDLAFPEGQKLLKQALPAARRIAALKARAHRASIPSIYVNDNKGLWRSDSQGLIKHSLNPRSRGQPIAEILRPREDDYLVLKPKQSAFFGTTLATVLRSLGSEALIIVGFAADICVQLTAADAFLRDFRIWVPSDCTAAAMPERKRTALAYIKRVMKANVTVSSQLDLRKMRDRDR